MALSTLNSFRIGIQRRWKAGLTQAFSAAGVIWLITEILTKVSRTIDNWILENGDVYFAGVIVVAAAFFVRHCYETTSVSFCIPTTETQIEIKFGDLFKQQTDLLIGVGEYFDSDVGHVVSKYSLHGQFIIQSFDGDSKRFRQAIDAALQNANCVLEDRRPIEPKLKYEIGTTAVLPNGAHKTFLVAMANTDLQDAKASTTVPLLWVALSSALESIRSYGNGAPFSLPLIGSGLSSINIKPQHLLRLIVLALVDFGRKRGLPKTVSVILPQDRFEMLDIHEISDDWRKK